MLAAKRQPSHAATAPAKQELVLLGGGHAHVEVIRRFGEWKPPGVRLTVISRDARTPYSGMLPGYISGFYTEDQCHIDLARLARACHAHLVLGEACGIDTQARVVHLGDCSPPVPYDALSIDVGIVPGAEQVPGALSWTTPVKPISGFVARFEAILARCVAAAASAVGCSDASRGGPALQVVVVGGGAGGVEVALALQHRLNAVWSTAGQGGPQALSPQVTLVSRGAPLSTFSPFLQRRALAALQRHGVVLQQGQGVAAVERGLLSLSGGAVLPFDECLWCTAASPAAWLRGTGLPTDGSGFLLIDEFLCTAGGPPGVFAVGDCATSITDPRPKAGVFAVRQGPPLADNLLRFLEHRPLLPHRPQTTFLSLVSTGGRHCIGSKGWLSAEGGWLWVWKDHLDRSFMHRYGDGLNEEPSEEQEA